MQCLHEHYSKSLKIGGNMAVNGWRWRWRWRWRYSHAADADVSVVRLQRLPRFIDGVALQVCGVELTVVGAEQRLEGFESRIIARGVGGGGGAQSAEKSAEGEAAAEERFVGAVVSIGGEEEELGPEAVGVADRAHAAAAVQPNKWFKNETRKLLFGGRRLQAAVPCCC